MNYICRKCKKTFPHFKSYHWIDEIVDEDNIELHYNTYCGPIIYNHWMNRFLIWISEQIQRFKER